MRFALSRSPDPCSLDSQSLRDLYAQLEDFYGEVESQEPEDDETDEYEAWLVDLEEIEDLLEEIREMLEN